MEAGNTITKNTINSWDWKNSIQYLTQYNTIGGGYQSTISATSFAFIGGGWSNRIQSGSTASFIGGGKGNMIYTGSSVSVIVGGSGNTIGSASTASVIVGGTGHTVHNRFAFIGGGEQNSIIEDLDPADSYHAGIVAGRQNTIEAKQGIIGGGRRNKVGKGAFRSLIGAGLDNIIYSGSHSSTIVAGTQNVISGSSTWSTPGTVHSNNNFIGAGNKNLISSGSPLNFIGAGFSNTITSGVTSSVIVGGTSNEISSNWQMPFDYGNRVGFNSLLGGGNNHISGSTYATLVGGRDNVISAHTRYGFIGGGRDNSISGDHKSVIVGGSGNTIFGYHASTNNTMPNAIVGGTTNKISGSTFSFIGGGTGNTVSICDNREGGFIGGGSGNTINAMYGSIPGGAGNTVACGANNSTVIGSSGVTAYSSETTYVTNIDIAGGVKYNCTILEGAVPAGYCYTAKTTDYIILVKNVTNIAVNPCDPCRVVRVKNLNASTSISVSAATCAGPTPGNIDGVAAAVLQGYSNTTAMSGLEVVGDGNDLWVIAGESGLQP